MLWWIIGIILAIWLIGFILDIAGGLIHLLLIVAGIVFVFQLITGKKKIMTDESWVCINTQGFFILQKPFNCYNSVYCERGVVH